MESPLVVDLCINISASGVSLSSVWPWLEGKATVNLHGLPNIASSGRVLVARTSTRDGSCHDLRSASTISGLAKTAHLLFQNASVSQSTRSFAGNNWKRPDHRLELCYLEQLYVSSGVIFSVKRYLTGLHGTPRCRAQTPLVPHQPIMTQASTFSRRVPTSTRTFRLCHAHQRGARYALIIYPSLHIQCSTVSCTKHYFSEVEDIEPLLLQYTEQGDSDTPCLPKWSNAKSMFESDRARIRKGHARQAAVLSCGHI